MTFQNCNHEAALPDPSDRLVIAIDSAPSTLDPRFATDATSMRISRLVFQALVSVDNLDLVPKPELALRWVQDEDDPTLWTVILRQDIRWHDGRPLTATDVVYTYKSVMDQAVGSPFRDPYQAHIEDVRALSPHVVQFKLFEPYATFLTDLVLGIVPAHYLKKQNHRFKSDDYIGSGPYRVRAKYGDYRLDLQAVDATKQGTEHLIFRTIKDEGTRSLALLGGSIDLAQNAFSPILSNIIEKRPDLAIDSKPSISFTYLALNLRLEALADNRVRQALAYAVPRAQIVKTHLLGRAELASGMLAPFHWAYTPDVIRYEYDPEYARELLEAAGYGPGGKPLDIQIKISTDRFRRTLARTIAAAWKQIGVNASVRSYEFGTFFADIKQGNFEAYLLDLPEPLEPDMYRWMLHSLGTPEKEAQPGSHYARYDRRFISPGWNKLEADETGVCDGFAGMAIRNATQNWVQTAFGITPPYSTGNRMFYANAEVDCHLELGLESMTRRDRIPHYHEVQRIIAEELPIIPLWHPHVQIARRKTVVDFEILPNLRLKGLMKAAKIQPGKAN
jgi:peptide/nickel transport system substrate-binding protein